MIIKSMVIEVFTNEHTFYKRLDFEKDLNIIRGENSSGKSSILNLILYSLGCEELLGGKGHKTMKPALRRAIEYKETEFKVIKSHVLLEIENNSNKTITIKRDIIGNNDPRLIKVSFGGKITKQDSRNFEEQDMYIHDPGSAANRLGFHNFLENFLNLTLPSVPYYKGYDRKLYIQTLFPVFFIEQTRGWSNFLSTIPKYYGIKNVSKRVIEFILELDLLKNEKASEEIRLRKQVIKEKWRLTYSDLTNLASNSSGSFGNSIPKNPDVLSKKHDEFSLFIKQDDSESIPIDQEIEKLEDQFNKLEIKQNGSLSGSDLDKKKTKLSKSIDEVNIMNVQVSKIRKEIRVEKDVMETLKGQLLTVKEDLQNNKDVLKLKKFGSKMNFSINNNICPTCHQGIKDSLLSQELEQTPMNVEDNIKFLENQKKMINLSIVQSELMIEKMKAQASYLEKSLFEKQNIIRFLKKEMIANEDLPSEYQIKRKLVIQNKIEDLTKIQSKFNNIIINLFSLSDQWKEILQDESELPTDHFSKSDKDKLNNLRRHFQSYLRKFGFSSADISDIQISEDTYLPMIEGLDLRFDSAASDHIRAIWAYTLAVYRTSKSFNGNHPHLLFFDEPRQQEVSKEHFSIFLAEIKKIIKDGQALVTSSISLDDLEVATNEIDYKLIKLDNKSIQPKSIG
ncbi:hypothetical protein [Alteribacter keqinensis]|uniref:Rad50/SbcC-type AAA domain-containing protein n=1 Tax=Alteribacter keqinensis TaxID=2483800 RepID=A0A3M7TVK6_9BACI|nr:hypothetical protein [Alteribacter keqinensis]RNA68794.1 hypothetical protein EBO34_02180 [Alteribacter keqinensis]